MTCKSNCKNQQKLWNLCESFIYQQNITCAESICQTDKVIENAYEFIESICDIVGYVEEEEEEEE